MSVIPTPGVDVKRDEDIRKDVLAELYWDSRLNIPDATVTVDDGVVTLRGTADSYMEKAAAVDAAFSVGGVIDVIDKIRVELPGPLRSDRELEEDVLAALAWDGRVDSTDIRVVVQDGVVTLSGTVGSLTEFDAALEDAMMTNGVLDVDSNLEVRVLETRPDHEIELDIVEALRRDALVDERKVSLVVDRGVVTLSGELNTAAERAAAEADSKFTRGVRRVVNNIAISPI